MYLFSPQLKMKFRICRLMSRPVWRLRVEIVWFSIEKIDPANRAVAMKEDVLCFAKLKVRLILCFLPLPLSSQERSVT